MVSALHTRSRCSYGEWVADGDGAGERRRELPYGDVLTDADGDGYVRTDGEAGAVGDVEVRTDGEVVAVGAWYVYDGAVAG